MGAGVRDGGGGYYTLTSPHVAELLAVARRILSGVLTGQADLLRDLRTDAAGPG